MGARRGILIKNGEALERGKRIHVVIFDKTGTLTEGKPKVTDVLASEAKTPPDDVLALAASIERLSEHPLAQAVVRAAREKNLPLVDVEDFENFAGKGVTRRIGNNAVMVGSARLLRGAWRPVIHHRRKAVEQHEVESEKTVFLVAR